MLTKKEQEGLLAACFEKCGWGDWKANKPHCYNMVACFGIVESFVESKVRKELQKPIEDQIKRLSNLGMSKEEIANAL